MSNKISRYKKIVVPIDGSGWSESAIPHAKVIAYNHDAELILLHVFKPPAHEYIDQIALAGQDEQIQQVRENIKQKLAGTRNLLREEGVNCRVQWIEGIGVAHLICDYINEEGADLVIMTSHGRTGLARMLFGSVAQDIMHGIKVPVMIVRPGMD